MIIKILKEKLKSGVDFIDKITTKKLSLPILESCLIETEDSFLKISSTNLESALIWYGLAKIEKEGRVCVSKKIFGDIVNLLNTQTIELFLKNNLLSVISEDSKINLKTLNPDEFPIIPRPSQDQNIEISSEILVYGLKKVIDFVSQSVSRPEIAGVFVSFSQNILKFTATDSFRLGEQKIETANSFPISGSFILPFNSAKEIIQIFSKEQKNVFLFPTPHQLFIESKMEEIDHLHLRYITRLIEGEYPNYEEIVPKKFETQIEVFKEDFSQKIKLGSLLASKVNEIKLKILPKEKKIEIFVQNQDLGEIETSILAQIEGKPMEISFNYKFLSEGISACEGEKIKICLTSSEGPAKISSLERDDFYYLLMPIKTS